MEKNIIKVRSSIRYAIIILILSTLTFFIGAYLEIIYWPEKMNYTAYLIAFIFAFVGAYSILRVLTLITLIYLKRYIEKLVKPPYRIEKIKFGLSDVFLHVFEGKSKFCTIRIENLNTQFPVIIVPLKTPLSFFNASSMRIVGDGNEVIRTRLPKAIWDLHTEFDSGRNSLIIRLNTENLKEKDDILSLVDEIKEKIEGMEYSDEHIKKIHDELVATNEFMKGHMCMKCGKLIPKSKLGERCPTDGKPHETRIVLLDIHAPYSQVKEISLVMTISFILFLAVELHFLSYYFLYGALFVITITEGLLFTGFIYYFYHNILNFKNMLRHFEVKKRYIFERIKKEDTNSNNEGDRKNV